jgi:hypothetical protein
MINHATAADKPLWFHWQADDEDWAGALDLPPAANRNHARARSSILLEAVVTASTEPECWISYSRRKGWYDAQGRRYRSPVYSFATVPRAVDELARLGLLEHDKAPAGCFGRQSRFRAAPALRAALRHELRARGLGLTQGRLARQVGLSRPQLTNLLRGRVGTSPEAAARLKTFLLEAA